MSVIEAWWPAPPGIVAMTTIRSGGVSEGPYHGLNLAGHVGDDPAAVARNRATLMSQLPGNPTLYWLDQVHGVSVARAGAGEETPTADAMLATRPLQACVVMTADCLPVLLCDVAGTVVAAAHAGWRGLSCGVIETTVEAMDCEPGELLAWLGPAIGPAAFEVGAEVRDAFCDAAGEGDAKATCAAFRSAGAGDGKFFADIDALARLRLEALGVRRVYGGGECTYSDPARFYSYRRDGQTGRMASLIYIKPP